MTETNAATGVKRTEDRAGIWFYCPKNNTRYDHFKVSKGGWLLGYWSAGNCTKSGWYRNTLFFVGHTFHGVPVEKIDSHTAVIRRADLN